MSGTHRRACCALPADAAGAAPPPLPAPCWCEMLAAAADAPGGSGTCALSRHSPAGGETSVVVRRGSAAAHLQRFRDVNRCFIGCARLQSETMQKMLVHQGPLSEMASYKLTGI